MVGIGGSLEITLLERLSVPDPVAFVDGHVVHVDRDPYVAGGVGDLVIDTVVYKEVHGLGVAVLDVIDTGLLDFAEVELDVVVFEIGTPLGDLAGEGGLLASILSDLDEGGGGLYLVKFVELDDCNLRLVRLITDLGESDVRLADPSFNGVGLYGPAQYLAGLAGGEDAAEDEPSVLSEDTAVIEVDIGFAGNLDHALRSIRCKGEVVGGLEGEGIDELVGSAVVVSPVAPVLLDFFSVGPGYSLAGGVAREAVQAAIGEEGLAPVLGGKELKIESGVALEFFRYGLVKVNGYLHGGSLSGDHYPGVEVIIVITQSHLDGILIGLDFTVQCVRNEVPLLRGVAEPDGAALDGADSVVDDLDAGILLVIETSGEGVAVDKDVHALSFEVLQVVDFQVRRG